MITKPPPNDERPDLERRPGHRDQHAAARHRRRGADRAGGAAIPRTFPAAEPSEPAEPSDPAEPSAAVAPVPRAAAPAAPPRVCPMASSVTPQPSRTRTSHGPMVAAAAPPPAGRPPSGTGGPRRSRAHASNWGRPVPPACTATAGTAAPAPAPAPCTHSGGEQARNSADSARMQTRPGTMKARPPASAPAGRGPARRRRWPARWRPDRAAGCRRRWRPRIPARPATACGPRTAGVAARCAPAARRSQCSRSGPTRAAPWPGSPGHAPRRTRLPASPGGVVADEPEQEADPGPQLGRHPAERRIGVLLTGRVRDAPVDRLRVAGKFWADLTDRSHRLIT